MILLRSKDDKLLCILACCDLNMGLKSITSIAYLMQMSGWDLNYVYSITSSGLKCRLLSSYINDYMAEGYIKEKSGNFVLTKDGGEYLEGFVLQYNDSENLEFLLNLTKVLSDEELGFICMLDIMIKEIEDKYGADGLLRYHDTLINNLKRLTSCYSDENFDNAVKLLRAIKEAK